jgi:uncharacterized protein (TIGR03000 family)
MLSRAFWSVFAVCAVFSGTGRAQPDSGHGTGKVTIYGYPYGPRIAPQWSYAGITGGAYVTYPTPPDDHITNFLVRHPIRLWDPSNGLSLCGPAAPVYGPLPTVGESPDLRREWRSMNHPGLAGYGFHGLYNSLPRPRHVSAFVRSDPTKGNTTVPPKARPESESGRESGTVMTITVRLPQAGAEVLVDGKPTTSTGTDRTFESPPLTAGTQYKYKVTARWMEGGQPVERSQDAVGKPGETIRLEFGSP